MSSFLVAVAVFAPLAGAIAVFALQPRGLRSGRWTTASCGVGALAAFVVVALSGGRDDGVVGEVAGLGLRVDRPSAVLLAVVMGTGVVVASFSRRSVDLDPRAPRFFALLGVLVSGSALVVVPGGGLALLVGWFASSWALIAIVGHRNELAATKRAQRRTARALLIGDAALLVAIIVAVTVGDDRVTSDVALTLGDLQSTSILGISAADLVATLIVIAGASRSALLPFHRWLVSTLAAPTPVSALVHAGFVSGAGLLLIRFGPLVLTSFVAVHLAFAAAVVTVLVAVGAGRRRVDVKGKLAWSTVAQMGFMVVQCAVGAFSSAVFHIAGHGMYKASMFLGAGDAVSSGLRSSRRAAALPLASTAIRVTASMAIATGAVALGTLVLPPDVSDGGVILVVVFAWSTVAHGVWGWLARGASEWPRSIAESALGGVVSVFVYLGGLRVVESFVEPAFGDVAEESGVGATTLLVTLGAVAALSVAWHVVQAPSIDSLRSAIDAWLHRTAHPSMSGDLPLLDRRAGRSESGQGDRGRPLPSPRPRPDDLRSAPMSLGRARSSRRHGH